METIIIGVSQGTRMFSPWGMAVRSVAPYRGIGSGHSCDFAMNEGVLCSTASPGKPDELEFEFGEPEMCIVQLVGRHASPDFNRVRSPQSTEPMSEVDRAPPGNEDNQR